MPRTNVQGSAHRRRLESSGKELVSLVVSSIILDERKRTLSDFELQSNGRNMAAARALLVRASCG